MTDHPEAAQPDDNPGLTPDGPPQELTVLLNDLLPVLPDDLTNNLAVYGNGYGAHVTLEVAQYVDDDGNRLVNDDGSPSLSPPIGTLYLVFTPDAARAPIPEGAPDDTPTPYILDRNNARALRDLLNIATARGAL